MANKKEVIKHSAAIQISNEVNLLQRRAWNVLLANAFDDLDKKDEYSIPLKDLCTVLDYGSNDIDYVKRILKALVNTLVEWNILGKDGRTWGVASLLAEVEIINGVCFYSYGARLRKRLYNPTMYAKINLRLQNKFKSKHTLALYELFVDYFNIKSGYGETPFLSVEVFRRFLGLKEKEYQRFKDFNLYIVKKAISEINKKSDLLVDVEHKKKGRKIISFKFRIKKNPNNENIIDIGKIEKKIEEAQSQRLLPIPEFEIDNQKLFDTLTTEFSISNGKATEILKTNDEFYIEEILEIVRMEIKAGKVKNIPGFTVRAIEEDYRRKKTKAELEQEQRQARKKQAQDEKELIERLSEEFDREYKMQIGLIMNDLSDEQKDQLIKDFERDEIETANRYIKKSYHDNGLNSYTNQVLFRAYVASKLLPEEFVTFENFAQKKGYTVIRQPNNKYKLDTPKIPD